ncbi:hypothetical protein [Spiroplasma floricola]|uniref:Uncharacterized protein n=1 Tax=Spiroplasma floricola 23-6 TaxID=1336749 RepID=A0A2K8SD23_9MOLU|nr:hypothetical protein [Spiroplasma floricola]AUB31356.1 hypothetical protein SFLOR_v1c02990 [Spiroplasma floricola 23-6]
MKKISFFFLSILLLISTTMFTRSCITIDVEQNKYVTQQFSVNYTSESEYTISDWDTYKKNHNSFKIYSMDESILQVTSNIDDNGSFKMIANGIGEATLTLEAYSNSKIPKKVKWKFKADVVFFELSEIKINKSFVEIEPEKGSSIIEIENFDELEDVKVSSLNENVATAEIDEQGNVQITALNEGKTKISVNAENAIESVSIDVEVLKQKVAVELSANSLSINEKAKNESIYIKNFNKLEGIEVSSTNKNIATANVNELGQIEVFGWNEGKTEITVNAENAIESVSIAVTVLKEKFEIEVSSNNLTINEKVKDTSIYIKNFDKLQDVKVDSLNENIATVTINKSGNIEILGLMEGKTEITINASNAIKPIKIEVIVLKQRFLIEVSSNNLIIDEKTENNSINITNFDNLEGVEVSSLNESIATANINQTGNIKVFGLTEGTTKVVVDAKNSIESVSIAVTVLKQKIAIQISSNTLNIDEDAKDNSIKIKNFEKLENIEVKSVDENIATVTTNELGYIEVTALKQGNTEITINASNAIEPVEINIIVVKQKISIQVSTNSLSMEEKTENRSININNFSELENVTVSSKNQNIATAIVDKSGNIEVSGLMEGATKIIVNASNAIEQVEIDVVVLKQKIAIQISSNNLSIEEKNKDSSIHINNFSEFENIVVNSADENIAKASTDQFGNIEVTALKQGNTKIIVNAENAIELVEIHINVLKQKFAINVSSNFLQIEEESKDNSIRINNFAQLEDIEVNSSNESIATAIVGQNGNIEVSALKEGTTKITVNASNAIEPVEIEISVSQKMFDIKLNKTKVKITLLNGMGGETVKIENYSVLKNVQVTSKSSGIIGVSVKDDIIKINGLLVGKGEITVNADNAKSAVIIKVTVGLLM